MTEATPKKSPRRKARESAVQGLYQFRVAGADSTAIETHLHELQEKSGTRTDHEFFQTLLRGVVKEYEPLQTLLQPHLDRPFSGLSPVEAAILLIGAYELQCCLETPYRVIINEAIELAKEFGSTEGHKYINGVLDKLATTLRTHEVGAHRKS